MAKTPKSTDAATDAAADTATNTATAGLDSLAGGPANSPPSLPSRIEPRLGEDGTPLEQTPPFGGSWRRDAEGALWPADEATATAAGLAWPHGAA